MQTLLIFEGIPEATTMVLIADAPDWLPLVDDLFLNGDDVTPEQEAMLLRVNDALCQDPEYYNNSDDPLAGAWVVHVLQPKSVIEGPVQVIRCGFLM